MLENVFYRVPKQLGYYEGYEDEDSIYEERPSLVQEILVNKLRKSFEHHRRSHPANNIVTSIQNKENDDDDYK
jgi:hypothetical protein